MNSHFIFPAAVLSLRFAFRRSSSKGLKCRWCRGLKTERSWQPNTAIFLPPILSLIKCVSSDDADNSSGVTVHHSPAKCTGTDHLFSDCLQFFRRKLVNRKFTVNIDKESDNSLEVREVGVVRLGLDGSQKTCGKFRHEHATNFTHPQGQGRGVIQIGKEPFIVLLGFGRPPNTVIVSLPVVPRKGLIPVPTIFRALILQFRHKLHPFPKHRNYDV